MPLIPRRLSASRRFPHLSWAWPTGSRERLVIAAGHADEGCAADALVEWLAATDIDSCGFAELRLLVRIASRFPETRLKVAERARLNGIVRQLWTKSRLALDSAAPALLALREAGVDVVVLKGMAFAALAMHNLKGRIAHDIDILVRPAHVAPALAILDGAGWHSTRGESGLLLRQRGAAFRSVNLVKPPFGDIDLHTRAYLTVSRDSPPETGIWARSSRAALLGAEVLVPGPTDRLVNAIAHGVLDAHRHSDWLVDCAQLVGEGAIDWPLVVRLAADLGAPAQVTLVLFYLRDVLGQPVPEHSLAQVWEKARSSPDDYYKTLLLGHPRDAHSLLGRAGRRLFKACHGAQVRAATSRAERGAAPRIKLRRIGRAGPLADAAPALRHRLAVPRGAQRCSLVVDLEGVGQSRRYVFEVNTGDRHLAQLRYRDRLGRARLCLGAEIAIPADISSDDVWIEARQSGLLPALHSAEDQARFGPRPFRVVIR
jgi:Uncharacterised nucleotidyltransferase